MRFGLGPFLDGIFNAWTVENALQKILAAITVGWEKQHKSDGTHGAVTLDTLTVADVDTDGNVTGSLVPTESDQDLGAEIELSGSASAMRPWRSLLVSDSINWHPFSAASVQAGMPTITRSTRSLTVTCGASGSSGSFAVTGWSGSNTSTFTIAAGATATGDITAGGKLTGTSLQIQDGITAPSGGGGFAVIYIDQADGDLKISFADGTVKTIVTDT